VGPRTGLNEVERRKLLPLPGLELSLLGRPARSQSLYRLHYPCSINNYNNNNSIKFLFNYVQLSSPEDNYKVSTNNKNTTKHTQTKHKNSYILNLIIILIITITKKKKTAELQKIFYALILCLAGDGEQHCILLIRGL
jgi:hypothetical protein